MVPARRWVEIERVAASWAAIADVLAQLPRMSVEKFALLAACNGG